MDELKPCPFCGREPEPMAIPGQYVVVCKCGARMATVNQGRTKNADRVARKRCAAKWNARCGEGGGNG